MKSVFVPRRENKQLPWIRISKESTHSKCDVCCGLDQYRRKCKTQSELEFCNSLKEQHTARYVNCNIEVQNYIQKSLTYPKEVLSFQIDGMDTRKSTIPRILEKSKSLSLDYRLPSKITGCITTSSLFPENRKIKFYINHGKNHISYPIIYLMVLPVGHNSLMNTKQ